MRSTDRDERCVIFVNRWSNKLCKHSRQQISDLATFVNQEIVLVREGRKCKVLYILISLARGRGSTETHVDSLGIHVAAPEKLL
jgi:hypothetical protein